jgi:non-ribosomal peptide synthetase-like protein
MMHHGLLHDILDDVARRWPQRIAVEVPPGHGRPNRTVVTYADLTDRARILADRLRPLIHGECVVGILLPRSTPDLYVAQLAVLKAGAAYTCLDVSFPDGRMQEILQDADVRILLTDASEGERASRFGLPAVTVLDATGINAGIPGDVQARNADAAPAWLNPASLAYVIYTSGTTGRPKGVMIEHRSIANLVASDLDAFELTPEARVAQGSSAAYDSSIEETWLAFAAGATLVVMDDETARSGPDVVAFLQRERISVFCPPPTLLRATGCMEPATALPELKLLYVGGEPLPRDVADRWCAGRTLVNGYGPTECTVTCLRDRVTAGDPITIGRPVTGATAMVLDDSGNEIPAGEQGELCIGGAGIARGYWKQPALTAARFLIHPRHGRLYRTGDLVHCDVAGRFFHHGRIDSQVKLRGFRIELEEIESRLAALPGVRAAACRVQSDSGLEQIVAFVVPETATRLPVPKELIAALGKTLPAYMVPSGVGTLEALPVTVGGKLDRAALPRLAVSKPDSSFTAPRTPEEVRIAAAFECILQLGRPLSIHDDFFSDSGGDSLKAAMLVTLLRQDPATAWITVRDVYDARSVSTLAGRTRPDSASPVVQPQPAREPGHPVLVTLVQAVWLIALFGAVSIATGWAAFGVLRPVTEGQGLVPSLVLAPVMALIAAFLYIPFSLLLAVAVKRLLIGRYVPLRKPAWSAFHLRHWMVLQAVRLVPWSLLAGTAMQIVALRALGARIGQRVHIHRGVDLRQGGWDLLDIGDDVTLGHSVSLRLVEFDAGDIVIGPVTIGAACVLETRAGVAGHAVLGSGACLSALSSLPAGSCIPEGERWDGIPARPAGIAAALPASPEQSLALDPWKYSILVCLARMGVALLLILPFQLVTLLACSAFDLDAGQVWQWMLNASISWTPWLMLLGIELLLLPLTLAWMALVTRLIGRVQEAVISRWSSAYVRVWLKQGLVEGAGEWLSGTLFWPVWLRWAGMRTGRGCEISTILDVVPELVEIGAESFLADGIYLGVPRIQQGRVVLAPTRLGRNTFLGNHVVLPSGQQLPDNVLLGIATPASEQVRAGTAWFGHPPFELPRREVVQMDRRLTHEPSALRVANRVFWEALRFLLPAWPIAVVVAWFRVLAAAAVALPPLQFHLLAVPAATFAATAFLCLSVVALKWLLLGRVRAGQHALWSFWCSRWDFLYVAWGKYARRALEALEGTVLLHWYLRAMGMKIGRRVVLGPGFAQVVDPDMIRIADGATVNAMFQAHTFEDRVLKIGRVVIGRQATLGCATIPLYDAQIGDAAHVAAHSVIMKGEHLQSGVRYEGAPTRPVEGVMHR